MNTISPIPEEQCPRQSREATLVYEQKVAACCSVAIPILAVVVTPLLARSLLYLLYLRPLEVTDWHWKGAVVVAIAIVLFVWSWWILVTLARRARSSRDYVPAAAIVAVLLIAVGSWCISQPGPSWCFLQWVKVRTEPVSYERTVLMWQMNQLHQIGDRTNCTQQVGFVGSSQIHQAIDLERLNALLPETYAEKLTLAGLGPAQYVALESRIDERQLSCLVLCLSEFDLFRDDALPVERLRWSATLESTLRLANLLPAKERWGNRGQIADLLLASGISWWRNRDAIRRSALGYWWDISPLPVEFSDMSNLEVPLVVAANLARARENARRNIQRTRMLEFNFACIELFAKSLSQRGLTLIVLEGASHPLFMSEYPPAYRVETRRRLKQMAQECEFRYLDESKMPSLTAEHFRDGTHLNRAGAERFTEFVATVLSDSLE